MNTDLSCSNVPWGQWGTTYTDFSIATFLHWLQGRGINKKNNGIVHSWPKCNLLNCSKLVFSITNCKKALIWTFQHHLNLICSTHRFLELVQTLPQECYIVHHFSASINICKGSVRPSHKEHFCCFQIQRLTSTFPLVVISRPLNCQVYQNGKSTKFDLEQN